MANTVEINGFVIVEKDSFPAKENPFLYDEYHMGTNIGKDLCVMYDCYDNDDTEYVILIDKKTGKRIKVELPKD